MILSVDLQQINFTSNNNNKTVKSNHIRSTHTYITLQGAKFWLSNSLFWLHNVDLKYSYKKNTTLKMLTYKNEFFK